MIQNGGSGVRTLSFIKFKHVAFVGYINLWH